jgi:hypothetical protein
MKKILTVLLLTIIFCNCSSSNESTDLQIRISNVSEFNFENIIVNASGEKVNFGNLNSNSKSEFKAFDLAYRYAYVELEIDGESLTLQPIDYVGETPLENGKYSYELNINQDNQIRLELRNE